MIAVVDYGAANLLSITRRARSLRRLRRGRRASRR